GVHRRDPRLDPAFLPGHCQSGLGSCGARSRRGATALKALSELAAYVASRIVWTDWVLILCIVVASECLIANRRPALLIVALLLAVICAFFPGLKRPKA